MTIHRGLAFASPLALALAMPVLADLDPIETHHYTLAVERMAEGLVHPWGMAFLPDGDLWGLAEHEDGEVLRLTLAQQ